MREDIADRFLQNKPRFKFKYRRNSKEIKFEAKEDYVDPPAGMRRLVFESNICNRIDMTESDYAFLKRVLRSNVGKPWNEIYSKICAKADSRSYSGHILRWNLKDDVHLYSFGFYVDSETGILKQIKKKNKVVKDNTKKVFEVDGKLYHKHNDVWYRVEMCVLKQFDLFNWYMLWFDIKHEPVDVFIKGLEKLNDYEIKKVCEEKYGLSPDKKAWLCYKKKSIGRREIAKIKKQHSI